MSENSITPPDGEEPVHQPNNNESADSAESSQPEKPAKENKPTAPIPPYGSGGDVILSCVVDQIGPDTYEVVISMDKLGVRKASKHNVQASTPTEAALKQFGHVLHALKNRRPRSVTIKCNVHALAATWNDTVQQRYVHAHSIAPFYLWDRLDYVSRDNGEVRVEHITPDQVEAAGLNREATRTLDREPRCFGISETSPTPNPEAL